MPRRQVQEPDGRGGNPVLPRIASYLGSSVINGQGQAERGPVWGAGAKMQAGRCHRARPRLGALGVRAVIPFLLPFSTDWVSMPSLVHSKMLKRRGPQPSKHLSAGAPTFPGDQGATRHPRWRALQFTELDTYPACHTDTPQKSPFLLISLASCYSSGKEMIFNYKLEN